MFVRREFSFLSIEDCWPRAVSKVKLRWTQAWRRQNKKGKVEEGGKKKARKATHSVMRFGSRACWEPLCVSAGPEVSKGNCWHVLGRSQEEVPMLRFGGLISFYGL